MPHSISDGWLRILGISLFVTIMVLGDNLTSQPITVISLMALSLNVPQAAFIWYLNRALIMRLRYQWLLPLGVSKRLIISLLLCTIATALAYGLFDWLRYAVLHGTPVGFVGKDQPVYLSVGSVSIQMGTLSTNLFHGFINALFFLTIYELLFNRLDSARYQTELIRSEQEREKLRVANLQSQLDVLKSQVNPHFLFNALNSLSSLISEDPQQAEVFVDKLSGVYRYVLQAGHRDLTTLSAELHFIDSYYLLLKTRYGAGLSLVVAIDEPHQARLLPPLTLQLLVENAVKHNVVSAKRPLSITLQTDGPGWLIVRNNRQPKATRALSNGVGLSNIVAKYQMLSLPQPVVEETDKEFIIRLPLPDNARA